MNAETRARHRADSPPKPPRHRIENLADPANTGPLTVISQNRLPAQHAAETASTGARFAAVTATSGMLIAAAVSGNAMGTTNARAAEPSTATGHNRILTDTDLVRTVQASPDAVVPYAKVQVQTKAAPPPPPPPPPAPVVKKAPVFTHKPAVVAAPAKPAPAPAPVQAPPAAKGAVIAAAAISQIGQWQDCTRLATRSLAAVGINYHGWPAGYLALGPRVSAAAAQPGDLIYYANGGTGVAHIAVYIGGGMAVHGGWNGNQTVRYSANVGSGPVFIRIP